MKPATPTIKSGSAALYNGSSLIHSLACDQQ